jgi:hypothetical protein
MGPTAINNTGMPLPTVPSLWEAVKPLTSVNEETCVALCRFMKWLVIAVIQPIGHVIAASAVIVVFCFAFVYVAQTVENTFRHIEDGQIRQSVLCLIWGIILAHFYYRW